MGSEMEERERWRRERRHEEETTRGWTVVHSLDRILVTFETSHDPMAPYLPSPWPLGTSLPAFAQGVPSPYNQGPLAFKSQYVLSPEPERLSPHAPTHPNTPPPPAVPSSCSSALVLGVNAASTASVPHTAASGRTRKRARSAERHGPWCCLLVRVLHALTDRGASSWRQWRNVARSDAAKCAEQTPTLLRVILCAYFRPNSLERAGTGAAKSLAGCLTMSPTDSRTMPLTSSRVMPSERTVELSAASF